VAFSTKVNEVTTGLVTTTGPVFAVGDVDEPVPDEIEPDPVEPDGIEGDGVDGIDGGGAGKLKVSDAEGVLAALVPIELVATTVNV
jgi:hypothetical protein